MGAQAAFAWVWLRTALRGSIWDAWCTSGLRSISSVAASGAPTLASSMRVPIRSLFKYLGTWCGEFVLCYSLSSFMIIIIGWPDHQPIMRATLLDMPGYLMLNFKELFKLTGLPMSPNISGANLLHMYKFFAWKGLSFILIPPPAAGSVPTVTLGTATTVLEVVLLLGAVLLPLPLRRPASELCLPPGVCVNADLFVLVVIFPSLKVPPRYMFLKPIYLYVNRLTPSPLRRRSPRTLSTASWMRCSVLKRSRRSVMWMTRQSIRLFVMVLQATSYSLPANAHPGTR